jgi:hypothetical protein
MPQRIVGLVGKGTGPKLFVERSPLIDVKGLTEGEVEFRTWGTDGRLTFQGKTSADMYLDNILREEDIEVRAIQFSYSGTSGMLICNVWT